MDPIKIVKTQAINKHKKQQLLVNNLLLYSLTTLTCSLFCFSPFWNPLLFSCIKVFLSVSLPQITSLFFTSKFFFIIGNLIVIFLVGESKIFSSCSFSDVYYDEYVSRKRNKEEAKFGKSIEERVDSNVASKSEEDKEGLIEEKLDEDEDGEGFGLPAEEINKRADDFISRVTKQRRLESYNHYICSRNE
ncbi:hypothetical protein Acr_26g0006250 [Actinidia rufa]|uniref:DUF4408 domain-containing protein n=1 Tax=Actinidia rufa TaxID=165716 RepID=A0A7J0H2V4_9ERIC|nr:hypothetical protein Acr_26g0006250 [Actinidia rufa]